MNIEDILNESQIKGAIRPFGVAIDYDDTFTSCRETWTKVIEVLRSAGAKVVCVSYRSPKTLVTDFPGEVFYTAGRPKAEFMYEQQIDIHVWIDDQPHLVGLDPLKRELREAFGLDAR